MLEINNLTKRFDKFVVFDNISLKIADGSIFGLVGINGAGKSTLLRCIAGVYHPEQGEIFFNSQPIYENIAVKKDFFFLPDEPYASVYMTGKKLESIYSSYYHEFDHALYDEILKMFQIDKNKKINTFSKGMKRRLYLALAFACKPKLLMLDEAFDGLDPLARLELKNILIKKVEEDNLTVIISSHSLRELEDICDSYALLDNKNIKSSGFISDEMEACFKVQMAFSEKKNREDFAFVNPLSVEINGRIVTLVIRGKREEYDEKFKLLNPLIIDDLPLNFEDFFISNVQEEKK